MDIDNHLKKLEQANHNIGRSEVLRDAARIVYAHVEKFHEKCNEAAKAWREDPNRTGTLGDDPTYNTFRHLAQSAAEIHKQITSLR